MKKYYCLVSVGNKNIRCTTISELAAIVTECEAKGREFTLTFREDSNG